MRRQHGYGSALGWENLSDHKALRCDVAMQTGVGMDRWFSVSFCLELKRTLARITFCRMSRALLVQMNGLGSVL
jgi:hypothetical protein